MTCSGLKDDLNDKITTMARASPLGCAFECDGPPWGLCILGPGRRRSESREEDQLEQKTQEENLSLERGVPVVRTAYAWTTHGSGGT